MGEPSLVELQRALNSGSLAAPGSDGEVVEQVTGQPVGGVVHSQAVAPSVLARADVDFDPDMAPPRLKRENHPTLSDLEVALAGAHRALAMQRATSLIATVIQELSEQEARDEVIAREDAVAAEKRRIASKIGHVVLTGDALHRDLDLVRVEVSRCERILRDRVGVDPRTYACRRNEAARSDLRARILAAIPASYHKEMLEYSMQALEDEYAALTDPTTDDQTLAALIERIEASNTVDEVWLWAQQAELAAVAPRSVASRPVQRAPPSGEMRTPHRCSPTRPTTPRDGGRYFSEVLAVELLVKD